MVTPGSMTLFPPQSIQKRYFTNRSHNVAHHLGMSRSHWAGGFPAVELPQDFYFSDANLRRDRYMKKTIDEGDGAIELEALLNFNRIKVGRWMGC